MGLLLPLMLGGLALTGIPWIIHRVRRPTTRTTPFSSVMFIPETVPPLRQRRKIEHPWLLLLRVMMLCLLAAAFARPYLLSPAPAAADQKGGRRHVLLVDTSLSATTGGQLERTIGAARATLATLGDDPVGLVAFQERAQVILPPEPGTGRSVAEALENLNASSGATDFLAGLHAAEQLLLPGNATAEGADEPERIIHLISDLQRTGIPKQARVDGLARGISLHVVPVEALPHGNAAVDAVVLERRDDATLIVRSRLHNYGDQALEGKVIARVNGVAVADQPVSLRADSGVNVSVSAEVDPTRPAQVEVELAVPDSLALDNVFYSVYTPEPLREIGVLLDPAADRRQPIPFLEAALAESQPVPWRWAPLTLSDNGEVRADLVVAPGPSSLSPQDTARLTAYIEAGGRLLLIPSAAGFAPPLAKALLAPAGIVVDGPRHTSVDPARYALLSWIDFADPSFRPFRSAAYSDFSMLRFHNYFPMGLEGASKVHVAARLQNGDGGGPNPAMVAFERGRGRVVAWAFPLDVEWSNITRTRRFVPLLHETIAMLLPPLPPLRSHVAGLAVSPPPALAAMPGYLIAPGGGEQPTPADHLALEGGFAPGFIRWQTEAGQDPVLTEAVNIRPAESDLRVMNPEEFLLRINASPGAEATAVEAHAIKDPDVARTEWGYTLLSLFAVVCLLETLVAARTGHAIPLEQRSP